MIAVNLLGWIIVVALFAYAASVVLAGVKIDPALGLLLVVGVMIGGALGTLRIRPGGRDEAGDESGD